MTGRKKKIDPSPFSRSIDFYGLRGTRGSGSNPNAIRSTIGLTGVIGTTSMNVNTGSHCVDWGQTFPGLHLTIEICEKNDRQKNEGGRNHRNDD